MTLQTHKPRRPFTKDSSLGLAIFQGLRNWNARFPNSTVKICKSAKHGEIPPVDFDSFVEGVRVIVGIFYCDSIIFYLFPWSGV